MSGSSKKQLRKEQNAVAMTEKQQRELKDQKKLKAYTMTFMVVMILIVAIVIGIVSYSPIISAVNKGTHAVTIGEHKLNSVDLTYFYIDAIVQHYNKYYNDYQDYAYMYAMLTEGIDFTAPLGDQMKDSEKKQTWADYYIEEAIADARSAYALYDKAMADKDFKLDEDTQKYLDDFENYTNMYAQLAGHANGKAYVRGYYGIGADLKSYKQYTEVTTIAAEYYTQHKDSLEYKDSDYRAYEKDKFDNYSRFSYDVYSITVNTYLKGGTTTKDENGKETTTYSDEEKKAAVEAARKDAIALTESGSATLEELNKAIQALAINKDKKDVKATSNENVFYEKVSNEDIQKFLTDKKTTQNALTYVERTTTNTDKDGKETKEVVGFYVVRFEGRDDNLMKLQNVRHILVKFTGGTKDDKTGETTYSDAEKQTAKSKAEKLLEEWKNGKKTEESFGDLAKEKTEDTGSKETGGLYEDIYPGQMVEAFNDWCFDENRKKGDTDIIETEYGYHIMYYVEASDITYRDSLIKADIVEEDMEKWEKELADAITVTNGSFSRINRDFVLLGK